MRKKKLSELPLMYPGSVDELAAAYFRKLATTGRASEVPHVGGGVL